MNLATEPITLPPRMPLVRPARLPTQPAHSTDGPGWIGCLLLVVGLATATRLANLGYASFDHTESWRANWMFDGSWNEARRFPPAIFLSGKLLQHTAGRSELPLRLPYAVAGIVCAIAGLAFCRRHFGKLAGLLAGLLIAAHPILVYYSRRQLEYSAEACFSVLLFWLGYEAYREPSARRLLYAALAGLGGLACTFTASLLIAAWWPVLLWRSYQQRHVRPSEFRVAILAMSVLLVAGVGWYVWLAGVPNKASYTDYYASTEAVWPTSYGAYALCAWVVRSTLLAAGYVVGMFDVWSPLGWIIGTIELLAVAAALPVIWHRRRVLLVVSALLYAAVVLAGAMKFWPFGALRHIIFLVPLVMMFSAIGLSELWRRLGPSPATLLLGLVCVFIPTARAVRASVIAPATYEHVRPAFEHVLANRQPGDALFVYYFSGDAFGFYWRDSQMPVYLQPENRRGDLAAFAEEFDRFATAHSRVWYVSSHDWKGERKAWLDHLKARYVELDGREFNDASVHLFAARPDADHYGVSSSADERKNKSAHDRGRTAGS